MAYAALVSVAQVIKRILPHDQDYACLCHKEQMESLHQNIVCLQQILEDHHQTCGSIIDPLENQIIDVSYQVEDMIKSNISSSEIFDSCIKKIDSIMEEAIKMKKISKNKDVPSRGPNLVSSRDKPVGDDIKVGLEKDLNQIKERATGHDPKLQIIPIVGMGGIGKTTLSETFYNEMVHSFDVGFWATISQEYNIQEILQALLRADEVQTEQDAEGLIVKVYKSLKGRKFLIVLDDIWHMEVWDGVRRAFPNDNNGSCIILTTRLSDLPAKLGLSSSLHQMQFLNKDESWNLFQQKVYGHESCPPEFEKIGKKIAKSCKGLPLAIIVIAGVVKFNKTREFWEETARNISAAVAVKHNDEFFGILSLSYTNLPPHLKPCFLYLGAFPEDYEIPIKRLIMLWSAEELLNERGSKSIEEVAYEYLKDLIDRNLVFVTGKRSNGKTKTSMLHDSMREVSLKKAQEEKFLLYFPDRYIDEVTFKNIIKNQRRLSVNTISILSFPTYSYKNVPVRSLLYFRGFDGRISSVALQFRRLKVLDGVGIVVASMFTDIFKLVNLSYLHVILFNTDSLKIPESISKLQNLETLIFSSCPNLFTSELDLPLDTWNMPQLKHLLLKKNSTMHLPFTNSNYVLDNLQSLSRVRNFRFTKNMMPRIPNLKKLKIDYKSALDVWVNFGLKNLIDLNQLEELSINFDTSNYHQPPLTSLRFPQNLMKLTLQHSNLDWENMSIIGSLPNLEVLNLLEKSFIGEKWKPIEEEFSKLKYLKMQRLSLKYWEVESSHFESLETLIIEYCSHLEEIADSVGYINTLQKFIIRNCNDNVEQSVRKIQEEQESCQNTELNIIIVGQQDEIRRFDDEEEEEEEEEEKEEENMCLLETNPMWQTYVDNYMMCDIGGNHLTSAAVIGHDGVVWAQSADFTEFEPEEISAIMDEFEEPGKLGPTGLHFGGKKYRVMQGEPGAIIRGMDGPGNIVVMRTIQTLLIGICDKEIHWMSLVEVNKVVQRLGDHLIDQDL